MLNLGFLCPICEKEVRKPNYLGRSWCQNCELYDSPLVVEKEPEGDVSPAGADHSYTYTTWHPRANSFEAGETSEHRFMFIKRKDRLVKGSKGLSYKAKCTCGSWLNRNDFTNRRAAHKQWEAHMAEVEKQGSLFTV